MKNKVIIFLSIGLLHLTPALADNGAYYFSQTITCNVSTVVKCDYDNTYTTLGGGTFYTGVYNFKYASQDTYGGITAYYNDKAGHEFAMFVAFPYIVADINVANKWKNSGTPVTLLCGNPRSPLLGNAKDCPFTHTPFNNKNAITNYYTYNQNLHKVIINNYTDYAIVLQANDFNQTDFVIYQPVPPHAMGIVAASYSYQSLAAVNLQFNLEMMHPNLKSENRTALNTSLFYANGSGTYSFNSKLIIDGNYYDTGPVSVFPDITQDITFEAKAFNTKVNK